MLIELLGERPSLWDDFNKDYSKHDVKDTAYKEIANVVERNITLIKENSDYLFRSINLIKSPIQMWNGKSE